MHGMQRELVEKEIYKSFKSAFNCKKCYPKDDREIDSAFKQVFDNLKRALSPQSKQAFEALSKQPRMNIPGVKLLCNNAKEQACMKLLLEAKQ